MIPQMHIEHRSNDKRETNIPNSMVIVDKKVIPEVEPCDSLSIIAGILLSCRLSKHSINLPPLIASRAPFGGSNFVHLGYPLLEFIILTFFVGVSFIL